MSGRAAYRLPANSARPRSIALLSRGPAWMAEVPLLQQQHMVAHARLVAGLEVDGRAEHAGPVWDPRGPVDGDPVGVVTLRMDADEARAIFDADPAVLAGVLTVVVRPWYLVLDELRRTARG